MTTFSPSVAPSEAYYLPPQAAPSLTFMPTIDGSLSKNPAVQFRITALGFLFSISGIIFTLIMIHQSIVFLLKKRWKKNELSKWEVDHQIEERRRLMEEEEERYGGGKRDQGIQFHEEDMNDVNIKRLDPSWIREKDFSMQWEDPAVSLVPNPNEKVLFAHPERWNEQILSSSKSLLYPFSLLFSPLTPLPFRYSNKIRGQPSWYLPSLWWEKNSCDEER